MMHFVGLDVSVKETSVCVVDGAGKVLCERKVPTEPDDIAVLLTSVGGDYVRVGIEAGPLSQWLMSGLAEAGLPMICVETRHMKALLTAQQINKTDRNDARGIAQMMRVGLFKPVHVKTLAAQEQRMLLTSRKLLQRELLDMESDLRGTLRNFGLKVGVVSRSRYEARVRELVEGFPRLAAIVEPLLSVRRVMRQQFAVLHKMLLDMVRGDPVCRRLMTAPGVGAVGQVQISGSSLPAVRVELNPLALFKYGIGLEDVRAALASANAHSPKGAIEDDGRLFQIYTNDQANHAADYRPLIVAYRDGSPVRLTAVGEVRGAVENLRQQGLW